MAQFLYTYSKTVLSVYLIQQIRKKLIISKTLIDKWFWDSLELEETPRYRLERSLDSNTGWNNIFRNSLQLTSKS